jgi:hypothetical protein
MATRKTSKSAETASPGTGIALIDSQLSAEAAMLKSQLGAPGGNKIKIEPSGNIKLPDGTDAGNEIQFVVVDFMSANRFYSGVYNSQNPAPPDCYAIGRVLADMAPEDDSPQKQHDGNCAGCPMNAFGSGPNGAKACKNTRELAVLLIDPDNPDAHNAPDAPLYSLSVPPTSLRSFDSAASMVGRTLGSLIKAVITMTATPKGTYASLTFSSPVANPDYAVHFQRRAECEALLVRKPNYDEYNARAAAAPGRGNARGRASPPARPRR